MKKIKMLGLLLVMILVVSACSNGVVEEVVEDEPMVEAVETTNTEDDAMVKDDEMMDEESKDEMTDDAMKEDEMTDSDNMEKDTMDSTIGHSEDMMAEPMNEGSMAEGFELVDLEGNVHNLLDYKDDKVYVKFWASWCSICLAGLEELNELAGMDDEVQVLTVVTPGTNGEKNAEAFTEWFTSLGYDNITVLLDEGATTTRMYGVRGYPTSAYIGSDGVLIKTLPGHYSNEVITETFSEIY